MVATSTQDPAFLDEVRQLASNNEEILILVRYVYGAGSRDFVLLDSMTKFSDLLQCCRERDSVTVMKSFNVICRGIVTDDFIVSAIADYESDKSWILIGGDNYEYTADWAFAESEAELKEELDARLGNEVCIVSEPDHWSETDAMTAYVPDSDGVVRPGAY